MKCYTKGLKKKIIIISMLLHPSLLYAETARDIIKKVDKNEEFVSQQFSLTMEINKGKRELIKKFEGYSQKNGDKSFLIFTNPEDRGVKYLKIQKELWIYFPDADDIMKISGHILRQGMMGSDISYEDMLESGDRDKKYDAKLIKEEIVDKKLCYVIELNAKVKDAAYAKQVLYIDKELYVPLKIEFFASGGRLIKTMSLSNFSKISGRFVAGKMVIQDKRKKDSKTTVLTDSVKFDIRLPAKVFSKRSLRR